MLFTIGRFHSLLLTPYRVRMNFEDILFGEDTVGSSPAEEQTFQTKSKTANKTKKRSVYDSDSDDDIELDEKNNAVSVDPAVKNDVSKQLDQYKKVTRLIEEIQSATARIQELQLQDNKNSVEEKRQVLMREADNVLTNATKSAKAAKDLLEDLKKENEMFSSDPENKGSAREQMRENLYLTHAKKFQAIMIEFSEAREKFRSNISERMVRQTKMVDGGRHSDEEIRKLVEEGNVEDIIGKALHSERIENIVSDLRLRNAEILKLQQSVQELYDLFKDLHTLIQIQNETLNVVENRILTATDYTEKGVKNLEEAQKHSKQARKCKCIVLLVLVVILVAAAIPLLIKYGSNF